MTNKLKNTNKKNKKKCCLSKKKITVKNLPKKPRRGGIPANDKNTNTVHTKIYEFTFKPFNSFNVLKNLISCKKKIKNIFVNKIK